VIAADQFIDGLAARGLDFVAGVPCSFLTPLINRVIASPRLRYVGATSEGEAVAISAGAALAGRRSAVIFQNSGLGNAVNPLSSLNTPFKIPSLIVTTWRGQPGLRDEPQHELMGRITQQLLDLLEIPHAPFPSAPDEVKERLDTAFAHMDDKGLPFALVMRDGDVAAEPVDAKAQPARPLGTNWRSELGGERPTRRDVLEAFLDLETDAAVIASTGKCGRELFTLADRPQHLYQIGSMGGASALGLGVALNSRRRVVVLDGDGAALMKLGNLATIGAYRPDNLVHVVLDNGVHDSTGGQPTVSPSVHFADIAIACGYAWAGACDHLQGFVDGYKQALRAEGPALLHVRIAPGSMPSLGRPTLAPPEVAARFRAYLATG
jgi:phosphonopyruvate decarboxylase